MGMIPYILSLIVAIIISLLISIFSWKRRTSNGARPLSLLMSLVALWLFCQAMQDISANVMLKSFWYYFKFIGVILTPEAWLILTLHYIKNDKYLSKGFLVAYSVIPALSLISVCTNPFFKTFQSGLTFSVHNSVQISDSVDHFWFWVHTYYSYLLMFLGIVVLISGLFKLSSLYRKQTIILILGAFIPLVGNILTVFKLIKLPYSDITPLTLLLTGILYFFALFYLKLLDLVPIARHTIIENMNDLILVLDTKNRIVDINPAMSRYMGHTPSSVIGKPAKDVLSKWTDLTEKFKETNEIVEKIMVEENNKKLYFNLNITPIFDNRKILNGRLIILRDITELENAFNDIRESREIAENANKSKSQFLANMSHEIRTPMNAIIGMSELLSSTPLNNEQSQYLSMIRSSASSLLSLINDILDFSKIEAGKLEIERIVFDIKELVNETIDPLKVIADNKNLVFLCELDEKIPHMLYGDPLRIRQILINLLSNAIKFTPEHGLIEINIRKIEYTERDSTQVTVKFSVTDTGIGIPEDKIKNLFQSFHQIDNSTTRKFGGTGLGLSIVKSLIEIMGGFIKVESKFKVGSTFTFVIPFDLPNSNENAEGLIASAKEEIAHDLEKNKEYRVLLAEDNKVNQMLMTKMIEKFGWQLDIADNGRKVLEKLEVNEYDVVLMDIQMPEMDGYEASENIRKNESLTGRHIPIIALTANAMKGDKEKCLEAGMDDYLSKPIKSDNLYKKVTQYLK